MRCCFTIVFRSLSGSLLQIKIKDPLPTPEIRNEHITQMYSRISIIYSWHIKYYEFVNKKGNSVHIYLKYHGVKSLDYHKHARIDASSVCSTPVSQPFWSNANELMPFGVLSTHHSLFIVLQNFRDFIDNFQNHLCRNNFSLAKLLRLNFSWTYSTSFFKFGVLKFDVSFLLL